MINEWEARTPRTSTIIWRILGLLLLCLLWLRGQNSEVGVVLLLFLTMMALARWRFALPGWTVIIDQGACLIMLPLWPYAAFGLVMPTFEGMLMGQPWYILPGLIGSLFFSETSIPLAGALIQAGFSGWTIRGWSQETNVYRQEADRERRDRYELESLKGELLLANVQVSRMAQLSERNRIAQELHDDVGHELTAAVLAVQAFEQLWKEEDPLAEDMFLQAKKRLSNSAHHLRETVHNMKPIKAIGIDRLEEICSGFTACPVNLKVYGDTSRVSAYLWSILEPCLKEALTNVLRHTKATKVEVSLDINPHIVRLSVHDDGVNSPGTGIGMGLRNLRQRARTVGGSVSTDATDGFRLVCVLPMEKEL
ncbi:integral membrane sensor signal transduction histidine kinase [Alkaliphilus metalliredigens QYMF]|uniref:histidine kinase n=1 Tax=Alkaliphilus metalliredigens (strain QYMF) TaxID=293826 RepID=A6TUG8_ALKMQ|nr:histidine kinase [Alkaliphilus metalliredigens]ABR49836.1 integral membrane sensor signal transduction histidine kinase [Alkaliphilus metalliredigens QYMF]